LKVTFLGTGTSQGVPVISCECKVCKSTDPRDNRLRTSVLFSWENLNIVVDAGPDFRQQMLRKEVKQLDAILITHEHNDHIIGLDDIRPFNFMNKAELLVFASAHVQKDLRKRFEYIFDKNPYPGAPSIKFSSIINDQTIEIKGQKFIPIKVDHGGVEVFGFRVGDFAYITDAKSIDSKEVEKLKGVKKLVVNALHKMPHHSHFNLEEALQFIKKVGPEEAYITHISHSMGSHQKTSLELPKNIHLAYDGLCLKL